MSDYESAADRAIRRAMEAGEFDDIPGKGKPLDLGGPYDADTWAARRIMKNAGVAPAWVEQRKEIVEAVAEARAALVRSLKWREAALQGGERADVVSAQWSRALDRYREAVQGLNKRIRDYNLGAPTLALHLRVIDAEREIRDVLAAKQPPQNP